MPAILAEDANGEPVELHCTDETSLPPPTCSKTVADPFVGKLSYLRVVSGKVTAGEPLVNARTGEVGEDLEAADRHRQETGGRRRHRCR